MRSAPGSKMLSGHASATAVRRRVIRRYGGSAFSFALDPAGCPMSKKAREIAKAKRLR